MRKLTLILMLLASPVASADPETLIRQAEQLHAQARQQQHAWVATAEKIKAARAALNAGDEAEAERLAAGAVSLAAGSVAQAEREVTAWQDRVLK